MSVVNSRLKRELSAVRQILRGFTQERLPWPEALCREAERLLASIREEEPDYERR
jgi:hypothetical protein